MDMTPPKEGLWNIGRNAAADAVVLCGGKILLIQREDGSWAFPGGFVDKGEKTLDAARREAEEETHLSLVNDSWLGYSGKVDDPRNSPGRWIETDAWVFEVSDTAQVTADSDARDANWFSLDTVRGMELYASHGAILEEILVKKHIRAILRGEVGNEVPVRPGHMGYRYRLFLDNQFAPFFAKSHRPDFFTDPDKARRSKLYLQREVDVMKHISFHDSSVLPEHFGLYDEEHLVMTGFAQQDGWHWDAPSDSEVRERYVASCLDIFRRIEQTPYAKIHAEITPSIVSFFEEGWPTISETTIGKLESLVESYQDSLHPATHLALKQLLYAPNDFRVTELPLPTMLCHSHHDARQANIAWHPEFGAKLVDWSWAGPGPQNADATSFLIDLAKSGHVVDKYLEEFFNAEHAKLLIGFWLAHATLPSRAGNESVRLHQLASAGAAASLVRAFEDMLDV